MRKVRQVVGAGAGALLLLGLGAGIGSAGQHTVTVEKTPVSCIEVLGIFEQTSAIGSKQMKLSAEALDAVRYSDISAMHTISGELDDLTKELHSLADRLGPKSADCRSK